MRKRLRLLCTVASVAVAALPLRAWTHPNLFVEAQATAVVDSEDRLEAIQVGWLFDETYSLYLTSELGIDPAIGDVLTDEHRELLLRMHTRGLEKYGWFTFLSQDGGEVPILPPDDFTAELEGGRFLLTFAAFPAAEVDLGRTPATLKIYDPSLVVGFIVTPDALSLRAPPECTLETEAGEGRFAPESLLSLDVGPDEGATLAERLAPPIRIACE